MIAQPVASPRAATGAVPSGSSVPPSASRAPHQTPLPELVPPASAAPFDEGTGRAPWKVVYTIIERGKGRRVWLRVGVAFVNRDQSLNVRLDALPISGQLHIREALPPGSRDQEPLGPPPRGEGERGLQT